MYVWWIYGSFLFNSCLSLRYLFMYKYILVHFVKNVFEKVTLTTVAELYNEGDNAVNHHGFARQVEREGNESEKKAQKAVQCDNFDLIF